MDIETVNLEGGSALPLTVFSEDEQLFRSTVREFAEEQIRPLVSEMDRIGQLNPDLIRQYFELGLMGIDIPESYGGSGS